MSTIPQLASLKKRLQELNMQKARYGISVDPSISIEADDLATAVQQMDLIEINRRNLDLLLRQRDSHGAANVPISISNQIMSIRAEIVRLRQVCARLGQNVPAHPVDDDAEPELPPIQPRQAAQPTPSDIRSKLDQIERLINEIRAALA